MRGKRLPCELLNWELLTDKTKVEDYNIDLRTIKLMMAKKACNDRERMRFQKQSHWLKE